MRWSNIQKAVTRDDAVSQVRHQITVTAFQASDIEAIDPKSELLGMAKFYKESGPAYTAWQNGKAIASGGLIICGKVAHAWGCISDAARSRPFFLHRTTVNLLALELTRYRVETVVVLTNDAFPAAAKWLERMGFQPGSKMTVHILRRHV